MVRRKVMFQPSGKPQPETLDDYAIYVTTRFISAGQFYGDLSIVRKTDRRKLYPFDGAEPIGPFATVDSAREAAAARASMLVAADPKNPE